MNQYITICFDLFSSFGELFDIDFEQMQNCGYVIQERRAPAPKAKFFDFLSKELERQVTMVMDPYKDLQKKYISQQTTIDALLFKNKQADIKLQHLQEQLNEKPSYRDISEIQESQNKFEQNTAVIQTQLETFQHDIYQYVNSSLEEFCKVQSVNEQLIQLEERITSSIRQQYALKEPMLDKLNLLETQFAFVNDQLIELKKYANQHINQMLQTQTKVLSDLTTCVKIAEFTEQVELSKQFIKRYELKIFENNIMRNLEQISTKLNTQTEQLDSYKKLLQKTDYEILQKATKMDQEILKREQYVLKIAQDNLSQMYKQAESQILGFYEYHEQQTNNSIETIRSLVNQDISKLIAENVLTIMKSYNLEDLAAKFQDIRDYIKKKANKSDILDIFNTKSNKLDVKDLESKVVSYQQTCTKFMKHVQEFMELFSVQQDLESFNFRKSQISKLITEVQQLQPLMIHFKSESQDEGQSHRRSIKLSPKAGQKVFLRPLLSTTFQVPKSTKMNKSYM